AKMRAGRFVALKRVLAHRLGEFEEIGNAPGTFQRLIKIFVHAEHALIAPEFLSELRNFLQRFAQSLLVARHSAFLPEKKAELSVERIERTRAVDLEEPVDLGANILLCLQELGRIRRRPFSHLAGE